jgi:hypothetical protein
VGTANPSSPPSPSSFSTSICKCFFGRSQRWGHSKGQRFNLFHIARLGVCTVSDDESALHRAIVKLTWTTPNPVLQWMTGPLVPGAGVLAHIPRGSPDLVGGCICNLTAPWLWNEHRNELSICSGGHFGTTAQNIDTASTYGALASQEAKTASLAPNGVN